MLKLRTPAGEVKWEAGRISGDARALLEIQTPRPGQFAPMPDQVDYAGALACADTFRHLVETIWPGVIVLEDAEPKEFEHGVFY